MTTTNIQINIFDVSLFSIQEGHMMSNQVGNVY